MVESSIVMFAAGVVILGITLAMLGQIAGWGASSRERAQMRGAVGKITDEANIACVMDTGSVNYFNVELPTSSRLDFSQGRLCISKADKVECERPKCEASDYSLSLDTEFYKKLAQLSQTVEIRCLVETVSQNHVRFSCQ